MTIEGDWVMKAGSKITPDLGLPKQTTVAAWNGNISADVTLATADGPCRVLWRKFTTEQLPSFTSESGTYHVSSDMSARRAQ